MGKVGVEADDVEKNIILIVKRDGIICFFSLPPLSKIKIIDTKCAKSSNTRDVYDCCHLISNFSLFCIFFKVDFGEVFIPPMLDVPRPRVLPEFKRLAHGLRSSNISVLDAKTFYIPNLHYDGAGPDAYFWVGNGSMPNIMGVKVPNELGSYEVLRGYQGEDIEIQLPGNLTVCEYHRAAKNMKIMVD